jgi:hypothetical protein
LARIWVIVDEHIDTPKGGLGRVEHAAHGVGVGDISLGSDGLTSRCLDFGHDGFRRGGVAGVIHHYRVAVFSESLGNRGAYAGGSTRYDRDLSSLSGHGPFSVWPLAADG